MKNVPDEILKTEPFSAFLADLATLGVTPVARGGRSYAVIAARSNARWWLLPLQNRHAAAAGLEMLQPVTKAAVLAKAVARGLARFGPHRALGIGHLRLSGMPDLAETLNQRITHVAYFTGTDGPHRKTALQLMDERGAILGYAKLSREPHIRPYIQNEAQVLQQVAKLGLKAADVPTVLSFRDDATLTLLVTDSIKSKAHRVPLHLKIEHQALLEELQAKTGCIGARQMLSELRKQVAKLKLAIAPEWQARLPLALEALSTDADTIALCLTHGDFTPWNTFLQNGRLYVFDWEYAHQVWPVGFDLTHFMLATLPNDQKIESLPLIQDKLAATHFEADWALAWRAMLLSLVCHAVFYLARNLASGRPPEDWADCRTHGAMIDHLLKQRGDNV